MRIGKIFSLIMCILGLVYVGFCLICRFGLFGVCITY